MRFAVGVGFVIATAMAAAPADSAAQQQPGTAVDTVAVLRIWLRRRFMLTHVKPRLVLCGVGASSGDTRWPFDTSLVSEGLVTAVTGERDCRHVGWRQGTFTMEAQFAAHRDSVVITAVALLDAFGTQWTETAVVVGHQPGYLARLTFGDFVESDPPRILPRISKDSAGRDHGDDPGPM